MNITDEMMWDFIENGEYIGEQQPTRESKWSFYRVYKKDDVYIAVVCDDENGAICAEHILEENVNQYID